MAATRTAVQRVAQAPARRRSAVRRRWAGRAKSRSRWRGTKTRWLAHHNRSGCHGKQQEARPDGAGTLPEEGQQERREESAEAAHGAHQAGDGAGLAGKILGDQLEHRAVSETQEHRAAERPHGKRHDGRPRQQHGERSQRREDRAQHARAADAVGEPASQRARQSREHHEAGGAESGVGRPESELVLEQGGQVDREGHESAEGQEIESRQQPGELLASENLDHVASAIAARAGNRGGVAGEQGEDHGPEDEQNRNRPINRRHPQAGSHDRSQEDGGGLADVAQSVNAQGAALPLRRSPAGDVAHADRERRARKPDQESDRQEARIGGLPRDEPDRHRDGGHQEGEHDAPAETVGEHAHRNPRQRSENDRDGHEKRRLRWREVEEISRKRGAKALIRPHAAKQTVKETVPSATWRELGIPLLSSPIQSTSIDASRRDLSHSGCVQT